MIQIELSDRLYQYDAYHISKAFFPNDEIVTTVIDGLEQNLIFYRAEEIIFQINTVKENELDTNVHVKTSKEIKHDVNQQLYLKLSEYSGRVLDWGFMTGIRPTKMAMKKWLELKSPKDTVIWLQNYYNVTEHKSNLAVDIAMREHAILEDIDCINGYSLYIGIPFCPTRCSYCSFTAFPLEKWKGRMDQYLSALYKELEFVSKVSKDRTLDTIYIGGGTPTSLEATQLDKLLQHIKKHFNWNDIKEITVEAGRPDSITREKLEVLKEHGVHRISINPQSMKQKTLCRVGRGHSVNQIYECYEMAREIGFDNINMDVILGLPYENLEDVKYTLEELRKLAPESLTVHTLAMKRTSKMTKESTQVDQSALMKDMVELAADYAGKMELEPYYLYRQKNIAGNFENVGYAKAEKACIYNVLMMEEKQSVVAVGAGSSSKIILQREKDNVIRIENVKDVEQYIDRIDEMIERKEEWLWH